MRLNFSITTLSIWCRGGWGDWLKITKRSILSEAKSLIALKTQRVARNINDVIKACDKF